MTRLRKTILAFVCQAAAVAAIAGPGCVARSGEQTTALVELYTSEGCSSCPPADAWLRNVPRQYGFHQLVPLALHVPYWDDLGWKDGFSQASFAQRQSWLVALNGHRAVYTPHFFVSGAEVRDWPGGLDTELRRVSALPAAARIVVTASLARAGALAVASEAATSMSAARPQLFLAVIEDGLTAEIRAGENRGTVLRHDHIVRVLVGPLTMSGGKIADQREISVEPTWDVSRLGIAAFVQDERTGRVLQATACALGG